MLIFEGPRLDWCFAVLNVPWHIEHVEAATSEFIKRKYVFEPFIEKKFELCFYEMKNS